MRALTPAHHWRAPVPYRARQPRRAPSNRQRDGRYGATLWHPMWARRFCARAATPSMRRSPLDTPSPSRIRAAGISAAADSCSFISPTARDTFINFREKAPLAAPREHVSRRQGNPIRDKSLDGYLAVGVPGTVLGLETAREKYGTLARASADRARDRARAARIHPDARRRRRTGGRHRDVPRPSQRRRRVPEARTPLLRPAIAWCKGIWRRRCAPSARAGAQVFYHGASPRPSLPRAAPMAGC